MRFVDDNLSKKIIDIAKKSTSFADIYERVVECIPKKLLPAVMSALELFYEEETIELPVEIKEAWRKYSGGFIRLSMLESIIDGFCKEFNVDRQKFLAWFSGNRIFSQKVDPEPRLFTGIVNFLIARRLLRRATTIILYFPKAEGGSLVKDVLFIAKRLGADVRIEENNAEIFVEVRARELSLEPLSTMLGYCSKVEMLIQDRRKIVIQGIPIITAFKQRVFDSTLERIFYDALTKLGVSIRKDPPILMGDLVFIPDFEIALGSKKLYVEIVGYYRVKYLIDKEIKIRRAAEMGIPLIVIAHMGSFKHLKHLANRVKFYWFSSKRELEDIAMSLFSLVSSS